MFIANREIVKMLKSAYPAGCRVQLDYMNDIDGVSSGEKGTVICVDDIGTVHVSWDCGRSLGVACGVDSIHRICGG